MRARLQDVAERAGVSIKTVSNVVNGTGSVNSATKARVESVLRELDYRPNPAAQHLRRGRSGIIAVTLPSLEQPYFAELAAQLVEAAQKRSLTVILNQSNGHEDAERRAAEGAELPATDGLIISPLALTAADFADRSDTTPLVLLGEHVGDTSLPQVTINNRAAAEAITRHLISRGHRRIAAVGVQLGGPNETSTLRLEGYRRAHEAAGLEVDESLLLSVTDFNRVDGARAVERMLAERVEAEALFCFNDLLALGALRTLYDHGLTVPRDIAVAGFDDIEEARFSVPSLTTMAPDRVAIAEAALDLLLAQPSQRVETHVTVDCSLVVRESTGDRGA